MGHNISAIILKGDYKKELAEYYDLKGIDLGFNLTMFHIDHYYSAYWQEKLNVVGFLEKNNTNYSLFPSERVLFKIAEEISSTEIVCFSIIATDYFGGQGIQSACVYTKDTIVNKEIRTINDALKFLGVMRSERKDEFEIVGLSNHRFNPEYLDKYADLADELGV